MTYQKLLYSTVFTVFLTCSSKAAIVTVPTGLNPGDQYRLTFVTTIVTDALSSDIDDYNTIVQDSVNAVPQLSILDASWRAVAATPSVDVTTNLGLDASNALVPIYSLDGTFVTDNLIGALNNGITTPLNVDAFGNTVIDVVSWVGIRTIQPTENRLGEGPFAWALGEGRLSFALPSQEAYTLIALSSVITVVPEPTSFLCWMSICLIAWKKLVPHRIRMKRHCVSSQQ